MKTLTEDQIQQPDESTSESDDNIHHIKAYKAIEEKNKHYIATIKINGVMREFMIDTGSAITIMPPDGRIIKSTGLQNQTNRYQDVNKNQVKLWGFNMEYESNKEQMKNYSPNEQIDHHCSV